MKHFLNKSIGSLSLCLLLLLSKNTSSQTLWYYNGSGALNSTSSWGTNTNGTGGTLTDFTSGGRYFIIQNTTSVSLSGIWNVGNTNFANAGGDSLIVGNPSTPSAAITFTLLPSSALTVNKSRTISVSTPSSGNHKIIYQNGTILSFGAIYDPNLEIVFDGATITSSSTNSFGNLSLINNANVNMGGANAKFRNISIENGSILSGPIGASSNFLAVRAGGAVTINGTFRAGKQGGLSTTIGTGAFSGNIITTGTSSTSTNSSAATSASTTGLTQTVTCASTASLTVGAVITVASGTGAFPANTYVKTILSSTRFTASAAATTQLSGATISATLYTLACQSSTSVTAGGAVSLNSGSGAFASSTIVTGLPNSTTVAISKAPTTTIGSGANVQVTFTPQTTWSTLVFEDTTANITLGSNSTIDFYRGTSGQTAAQTIDTLSYANLIISNSTTASNKSFLAGTVNISGSLTFSNFLGTLTQPSTTTINFTGLSTQTIPSQLTTFSVLGISGGTKTMSGNISVTSSLNLTSGVINTNGNTLTVTSSGTVSRTNGWVQGNLNRNIGTGTNVSRVFHIGDATNYTPITLTFASVTTAGNLTASTGTPITSIGNYATAPISQIAYVNRYWNISSANSPVFTDYTTAMTYVTGDLTGGATGSSLVAAKYTSGWTKSSTTNSGNTNTTSSSFTTIGNFILANDCITVTPGLSISGITTFCTGTTNTYTATPTDGGTSPTYQWKKNSIDINGAVNTSLTLATADVTDGDVITCVMTANNLCQTSATAISNILTLSVGATVTPSASISTATNIVCSGNSVSFSVSGTNGGTSPVYQWKKNGADVSTGTTITFAPNALTTGDVVRCMLTSNRACLTTNTANSNTITLTVIPSPVAATISSIYGSSTSAFTMCNLGNSVSLYPSVSNGVWSTTNANTITVSRLNGTSYSGVVTAVNNGTATIKYTLTTPNSSCTTASSVVVTVAQQVTPNAITGVSNLCVGSNVTYATTSAGGVWAILGRGTITNTGDVSAINAGTTEVRYIITNASGCSAYSSKAITVNPLPAVPTISFASGTTGVSGSGGYCKNKIFTLTGKPVNGVWGSSGVVSINPSGTNSTTTVVNTGNVTGAFSITYTTIDANGCSNSRTIPSNIVACRGLSSQQSTVDSRQLTIYPNPSHSIINLKIDKLIGAGSIVIADLYGKQIKQQPLSLGTNTIDISSFAKGIYLVSVISEQGKQTQKVILE